jgi:hypothetical protein
MPAILPTTDACLNLASAICLVLYVWQLGPMVGGQ